jgi:hypothetical protein
MAPDMCLLRRAEGVEKLPQSKIGLEQPIFASPLKTRGPRGAAYHGKTSQKRFFPDLRIAAYQRLDPGAFFDHICTDGAF